MNDITTLARSLAVLCAAFLSLAANSCAQDDPPKPKDKPESWAVVQVNDEIRVIPAKELPTLKKQLEDDYKAAMEEYQRLVKEAKENKEDSAGIEKPKKPKLKAIKGSIKDEASAEKIAEEARTKAKKRGGKEGRREKPGKKPAKTPAKKPGAEPRKEPGKEPGKKPSKDEPRDPDEDEG